MNKEEIKYYLKMVDELEVKLTGEDRETLAWLIYAYNQCAKLLNETEQQCKKQKEVINKAIEYINENKDKYYQDWGQDDGSVDIYLDEYEIKKLLDVLKEVSEWISMKM